MSKLVFSLKELQETFNLVNYSILLCKLRTNGFGYMVTLRFCSNLSNRNQLVGIEVVNLSLDPSFHIKASGILCTLWWLYPFSFSSFAYWDEHSAVPAALLRLSSSTTGSRCRDAALGFIPSWFPGKQSSVFHITENTLFYFDKKDNEW